MLPYGIIATLPCFTGIVFVSGTLVVVRWLPDPLLAMILPWGCCIEEGGNPVVSTISEFFELNLFYYLLYYYLPLHLRGPMCFRPTYYFLLPYKIFHASSL